jgi:AhpD family alkylhydroperoxidase
MTSKKSAPPPPLPEPALNDEFEQLTQGTASHIRRMRHLAILTEGALPVPIKILAALLWSISARCEPCVDYYAQLAALHGATPEQVGEALAVAITMGGCVGKTWAKKAYLSYRAAGAAAPAGNPAPTCCGGH